MKTKIGSKHQILGHHCTMWLRCQTVLPPEGRYRIFDGPQLSENWLHFTFLMNLSPPTYVNLLLDMFLHTLNNKNDDMMMMKSDPFTYYW